jgi:DNA-binding ferritin-like protein
VTHAQGWADEAAERIVALGLPVDARLSTVAAEANPHRRRQPTAAIALPTKITPITRNSTTSTV